MAIAVPKRTRVSLFLRNNVGVVAVDAVRV